MQHPFACFLLIAAALIASPGYADTSLEEAFSSPPPEARTRCFWWWLNGNVTPEAITRDLEEMKAKGMGGALIFDASSSSHRTVDPVPPGPMYGTPAWRALFCHAVTEAHRLGLVLGLNIQSGWNLGAPDLSPEESAKQLTWAERVIEGGREVDIELPEPRQREGYYRDIATLAVPLKAVGTQENAPRITTLSQEKGHPATQAIDGDLETFWVSDTKTPGAGPTPEKPLALTLTFKKPVRIAGCRLQGRPGYAPRACRLQYKDAQKAYQSLIEFEVPKSGAATITFAPTEARTFRLVITGAYDPKSPDAPRNVQVAEWVLLDEAGKALEAMQHSSGVRDLALKAAFHELGGSAPDCRGLLESGPELPGDVTALSAAVRNLTDKADTGRLRWQAPEGRWRVIRFGYTLTGARISTASGDWQGPVLDYMSTPALEAYWARHVAPLLAALPTPQKSALIALHTDSWECGGMNWTPGFAEYFSTFHGYDPLPWLPVIAGGIIESRAASNRFLADFRKAIAECVAQKHYRVLAEKAHAEGLTVHPESGGPHAGPFDGIRNLGLSDMPMGEFWVPSAHRPKPENRFFVKQAASAAHIYGKPLVAAEAFTSIGPHWEDCLWRSVKPSFNHEACAGLNLTYLHTFTCSPASMGLPGQEYFAGTHFNPQCTWWPMAGAVISYFNRSHALLQAGDFVADAAYYYGDHVPNIAGRKEADPAGVLPGYDYDCLDEASLLKLQVEDKHLVLPSGMRYRLLVLPDHRILSLPALEQVNRLAQAGAAILGNRPERTASLRGFPESERRFAELVGLLWGAGDQGEKTVGQGRVLWGFSGRDALARLDVTPDCSWEGDKDAFGFIHRKAGEADIYFVSSRGEAPVQAEFSFRMKGKRPEIWDPLTGSRTPAQAYDARGPRTLLPLDLPPYGAAFVIFRSPLDPEDAVRNPEPVSACARTEPLPGPWRVAFDPRWGGPEGVDFKELISWTERPEAGIRHYAGTARYTTAFTLSAAAVAEYTWQLELGEVRELARVSLNGRDLGVCWSPPFRVALGDALQPGENQLEIAVVNNWPNRLIADAALPEEERLSHTNVISFSPEMPLTPSGLLGPVRLLGAEKP